MNNYCVYWYHFEEHSNPYKEGYIGITNDINRRKKEHTTNINCGKFSHFYNAVRCYKDKKLCLDILYNNISLDKASNLENLYRPNNNIAWNAASGGADVLSTLTTKVILFHISDPKKEFTFNSITEASNSLNINIGRISQAIKRKRNTYGRDGWHIINENTNKATILTYCEARSKALKGIKKIKPSIFKGKKDRWSEEQKALIGSYHKNKTLSKEHIESMKEKNKHSSSCCKIIMKHKDDNVYYEFFSISEASRQLNLPLSRLKSKAQRPLCVYGKDGWAIISKEGAD